MSHEQPRLTVMEFESKFKEFKVLVEQDLLIRKITTLKAFLGKTTATLVEDIPSSVEEKKQL
jgi:hypothetical protein